MNNRYRRERDVELRMAAYDADEEDSYELPYGWQRALLVISVIVFCAVAARGMF